MKKVIYCFSGTGNNLKIAKLLSEIIGETTVIPMIDLCTNKDIPGEYDWVGFVTPSYYSHVPPMVFDALSDLKFYEHQKIFTIVGCGINRGAANKDLRDLLLLCNKEIQLEYSVAMPGSYIIGYNGFPKWVVSTMTHLAYRKIKKIASDIMKNNSIKMKEYGLLYRKSSEVRLQKEIKEFSSICQQYTISGDCTKCKTCIEVCPVNNISIIDDKICFSVNCQQCMACIQWCPNRAIDYNGITHDRVHYHNPDISLLDMKKLYEQSENLNKEI